METFQENIELVISPEQVVNDPPDYSKQKQIDQLTLEMLVNKRQYRKYLEKTNSEEYEYKRENYALFCKYKKNIGSLFMEMLNDYSISGNSAHLGNTELQDIFGAFIKKSAYFFETKEHEISQRYDYYDDSEMMFMPPPSYTDEPVSDNDIHENTFYSETFFRPGNSFWGKNIVKHR